MEEESLLKISEEKEENFRWGLLWDPGLSPGCQGSLKLYSHCSLLSGNWEVKRRRRRVAQMEEIAGILASGSLSGLLSLVLDCHSHLLAHPRSLFLGLKEWTAYIRRRRCWARAENSNSAGGYCSGGDGATGSGKAAKTKERRRVAVE